LGHQDRTLYDVDQPVAQTLVKAEKNLVTGPDGGQDRAAPTAPCGRKRVPDRHIETAVAEGGSHLATLPGEIGTFAHVLQGAAAAGAKMPADRRDALRRGDGHLDEVGPRATAPHRHRLAWQREWDEHGTVRRLRDAVALVGERRDLES